MHVHPSGGTQKHSGPIEMQEKCALPGPREARGQEQGDTGCSSDSHTDVQKLELCPNINRAATIFLPFSPLLLLYFFWWHT